MFRSVNKQPCQAWIGGEKILKQPNQTPIFLTFTEECSANGNEHNQQCIERHSSNSRVKCSSCNKMGLSILPLFTKVLIEMLCFRLFVSKQIDWWGINRANYCSMIMPFWCGNGRSNCPFVYGPSFTTFLWSFLFKPFACASLQKEGSYVTLYKLNECCFLCPDQAGLHKIKVF